MTQELVFKQRSSGILLPVSSLPSKYGIGTMGKEAIRWIDFLHQSGQSYWQVLPLGPTSYGDSPYQSFSAFAGNPYFIDLETLIDQGLLHKDEVESVSWGKTKNNICYETLFKNRKSILIKAFSRFKDNKKLEIFRKSNTYWLEDYALYMSIKSSKNYISWLEWEDDIRMRDAKAIEKYKKDLKNDIDYYTFEQYMFFSQWTNIKKYAEEKNIGIIGDIPIYVALDSADVWSRKEIFQLDEKGFPIEVAGVPPDYFSEDGQLWGNPLYKWDILKKENYKWWIKRIESSLELYDVLRIDHFRGLESYYAVDYTSTTAKKGRWKTGPGIDFINQIKGDIVGAKIIAEDLGLLTEEVYKLLKDSGFPGMKVLQFAFDTSEESDYSPYSYNKNTVVYTGTHDNDTVRGWIKSAPEQSIKRAMEYMNCSGKRNISMAFIRLAMQTASNLCVVPMQDWLNLSSKARINTPATVGGTNWQWRMKQSDFSDRLKIKIRDITNLYGRGANTPTL